MTWRWEVEELACVVNRAHCFFFSSLSLSAFVPCRDADGTLSVLRFVHFTLTYVLENSISRRPNSEFLWVSMGRV